MGAAREVYKTLGHGHLEATYEAALAHEISLGKVCVSTQVSVPVIYKGRMINNAQRLGILVEDVYPVELKAVATGIKPIHKQQLEIYMDALELTEGIVINFGHELEADIVRRTSL